MKKYLAIILSALMCLNQIPAFAESGDFTLRVEEGITAAPGETVEVDLIFENNPGLVGMILAMDYADEKMKLVDVKDGGILENFTPGPLENVPIKFVWASASEENFTGNGTLVTLTFEIKKDAALGNAHIATRANDRNVKNVDLEEVPLTFVNGYVQVVAKDDAATEEKPEGTEEPTEEAAPMNFADVAESDWFANGVKFVNEKGWMSGVEENTFAPNGTLTRAMLVSILHRMEAAPEAESAGFADVDADAWYAAGVNWAAMAGIVSGVGDGTTFAPNENVTREQIALILSKYVGIKGNVVEATGDVTAFADGAEISGWALDAVKWAVGANLLSGKGEGNLDPKGNATRAEIASILTRLADMM